MSDESVEWQNWSGSQRHNVKKLLSPATVADVIALVREAAKARQHVRCVGSSHSFVPFWTDDVIVSLDRLAGLIAVDRAASTATIAAGTKLHDLGPLLWAHGLSLPQQGDIDRQSLAGALSTGTHGTGRTLPNLSSYLVGASIVTADGELRRVDTSEPELLSALRVSQGTLGVMTDATLRLDPAFNLHEKTWTCSVEACAEQLPQLIDTNRHFEFFWAARDGLFQMKTLNKTDAAPMRVSDSDYIAPAYETFPSDRDIKFNEMEYSIPFARGWQCFEELRAWLLKDHPRLPWPLEYRTLAADDAMLSSAFQRESVTISVHQGAERDYRGLFDPAEAIFRNHGGRPHWGKLHSMDAAQLARAYPLFERFQSIRASLDGAGMFLNPYLEKLFLN